MNDEKRNHPPDLLAGEEHLSQLYQETSKEVPPPGLDVTILDAARQAAHRKPRRVYFLASRKWAVPLSLAAAFVVTIGVVRSLRHEIALPVSLTRAPAEPQSSIAPPLDDWAKPQQQEQELSQAKEASSTMQQTTESLGKLADTDTKRFSLPSAPTLLTPTERQGHWDAPRLQAQEQPRSVPLPVPSSPSSALVSDMVPDQGKANVGAIATKPQPQTPEQEQVSQGPARRDEAAGTTSLRVSEDDVRSVEGREKKIKTEMVKKDALSPEDWIAEIKKLRQTGKLAEAEASLKAFKQRYPDYPVEKALALPLKSHSKQKGVR